MQRDTQNPPQPLRINIILVDTINILSTHWSYPLAYNIKQCRANLIATSMVSALSACWRTSVKLSSVIVLIFRYHSSMFKSSVLEFLCLLVNSFKESDLPDRFRLITATGKSPSLLSNDSFLYWLLTPSEKIRIHTIS